MAYAAILSREEVREAQRRTAVRQRLHARFDRGLQRVEDQVKEPQPTVEELPQAVCALRQDVTPAVTEGLMAHAHRAGLEPRTAVCPQCGQTLSARGPQERPVDTRVGAIRRRRPYLYCARCQHGTAPRDEGLQLTERRKPPAVPQAAVKLTREVP
jgi:hypothetical protein